MVCFGQGGSISNLNYNTVSKLMFRNEADISDSQVMGINVEWGLYHSTCLLSLMARATATSYLRRHRKMTLHCSAAVFQQGSQLIFKRPKRAGRRVVTSVWVSWRLHFITTASWLVPGSEVHFCGNPCQQVSEDSIFFYFVTSFHNKIAWVKWNNKVPENMNNECEEKPHFKFCNISKKL